MPPEPRSRRGRQATPGTSRVLPGMPLEFGDSDFDDPDGPEELRGQTPLFNRSRFRYDEPRGSWWRPQSKAGKIFLGLTALAVLGGLAISARLSKRIWIATRASVSPVLKIFKPPA